MSKADFDGHMVVYNSATIKDVAIKDTPFKQNNSLLVRRILKVRIGRI
jgi:hypothetical protein